MSRTPGPLNRSANRDSGTTWGWVAMPWLTVPAFAVAVVRRPATARLISMLPWADDV
jgi:hypothetical protein